MVAYTSDVGLNSWGIYDLHQVSLPIYFTKDPHSTQMFEGLGDKAWELQANNFTYNSHRYGISQETFKSDKGLKSFWEVTSNSLMPNGTSFVASIEAKEYPIFGT
jgi:gamma-glutamyl hydrolase